MGYIPGDHPAFADPAVARGRGVNTDEASSALGDLRRHLTRRTYAVLAAETPPAEPDASVRANPAGDDGEDDGADDAVMPARELFPLAFLVTGMWGPEPSTNLRPLGPELGRRALPIARDNPYDPRMSATFFERMERLEAELRALGMRARQRYERKGVPRGARKRPWEEACEAMLAAVRFVRSQQGVRPQDRSVFGPHPLGLPKKAWGVLAAQGNKKLPFVAYSELPMATCPGAGACGVRYDYYEAVAKPTSATVRASGERVERRGERRKGWCYSFKAWRYPDGFKRQFLNTLANYADREFAILAAGGPADPSAYAARVRAAVAALDAPGLRLWPQAVKAMALAVTKKARRKPDGKVFLRLFVDGDVNHEDSIVAWMQAVAQMGPGSPDLGGTPGHIEVYGYSKCWQQFVNVDGFLGGRWPANYTVNLSSGSVYFGGSKYAAVRAAMERLPISRGYFEAVPLQSYLRQLEAQTALLARDPSATIPMPPEAEQPFRFDPERIRGFLRLNAVRTAADVLAIFPDAPVPRSGKTGAPKEMAAPAARKLAFDLYFAKLLAEPAFGARVRRELSADAGEREQLDAIERAQQTRLAALLASKTQGGKEPYGRKALHDKALAMVLHETLWSFGLGGSCPLVCGSCGDNPADASVSVHRCASKTTFKGKTIHIGIH